MSKVAQGILDTKKVITKIGCDIHHKDRQGVRSWG
jgi:hypothetical protein